MSRRFSPRQEGVTTFTALGPFFEILSGPSDLYSGSPEIEGEKIPVRRRMEMFALSRLCQRLRLENGARGRALGFPRSPPGARAKCWGLGARQRAIPAPPAAGPARGARGAHGPAAPAPGRQSSSRPPRLPSAWAPAPAQ